MEYVIENDLADDINEICKSFDFAKCNYIDTIDDGIVEIYLQIKDNAIDEPFYQLVESAAEHNNISFDSNQDFTCLLKVSWNYKLDHEHIDNSELYFYDFIVLSLGE